jgi:alpha-L-arabinofuranosidase
VKCFLDGELILQGERKLPAQLYAVAGRDAKTGEIIVHAVNPGAAAQQVEIDTGLGRGATFSGMRITTLASGSLDDENTLDEPRKIFPREECIDAAGAANAVNAVGGVITRTLPPHSYSVLRLKIAQ